MLTILQKIEKIEMMGDRWHNNTIDILFNGVDKRSTNYKRVSETLNEIFKDCDKRWLPLPNRYAWKINALMKSKSEATFQKRLTKYLHFLVHGTRYGHLFHKRDIQEFSKLLERYEV